MTKPEIFLSYAWGGESEQIVNDLDAAFQQKGITLIRDKRDLDFKGMISGFMQRIGEGKAVVTVISDKYLKSPYCMFELLEIYRNLNFSKRIFPIVLEDADIFNYKKRLEYLEYWQNKKNELDQDIKKYGGDAITVIGEDYKINIKIFDNYGEIVNILRDINSLTPDMHRADNFSVLIDAVAKLIDEDKAKMKWELNPLTGTLLSKPLLTKSVCFSSAPNYLEPMITANQSSSFFLKHGKRKPRKDFIV